MIDFITYYVEPQTNTFNKEALIDLNSVINPTEIEDIFKLSKYLQRLSIGDYN